MGNVKNKRTKPEAKTQKVEVTKDELLNITATKPVPRRERAVAWLRRSAVWRLLVKLAGWRVLASLGSVATLLAIYLSGTPAVPPASADVVHTERKPSPTGTSVRRATPRSTPARQACNALPTTAHSPGEWMTVDTADLSENVNLITARNGHSYDHRPIQSHSLSPSRDGNLVLIDAFGNVTTRPVLHGKEYLMATPLIGKATSCGDLTVLWRETKPAFRATHIPGCVCWLDAAQVEADHDGNISAWTDMSPSENDARQSAPDSRPVLVPTHRKFARLDVVGFDSGAFLKWSAFTNTSREMHVFVVLALDKSPPQQAIESGLWYLSTNGLSDNYPQVESAARNGEQQIYLGAGSTARPTTTTLKKLGEDLTVAHILEVVATEREWTMYYNGREVMTRPNKFDWNPAGKLGESFGAAFRFKGQMGAFVAYERRLTDSEAAVVRCGLAERFRVAL